MEAGSFRKGLEGVGRFFTRKLTPERRKEILVELSEKEQIARRGILHSPLLAPNDNRIPEVPTLADIMVVQGKLPFSAASDGTLKHIYRLTRVMEKAEQRNSQAK
mgnify:CR=1 FL=1